MLNSSGISEKTVTGWLFRLPEAGVESHSWLLSCPIKMNEVSVFILHNGCFVQVRVK